MPRSSSSPGLALLGYFSISGVESYLLTLYFPLSASDVARALRKGKFIAAGEN